MEEAKHRLVAAEIFCAGKTKQPQFDTESSCLQLRKVLELIAFASIAPHKSKYAQWRAEALNSHGDFRKDFNGKAILTSLMAINPYSFPRPFSPPVKTENGWHFPKFHGDCLTKKKYERLYDKCGALLHADNPWGNKKFYQDFRSNIPKHITLIRSLLNFHNIIVQHAGGSTVIFVILGDITKKAKGYIGCAEVDCSISENYYE
jgi:hypothetical protein